MIRMFLDFTPQTIIVSEIAVNVPS